MAGRTEQLVGRNAEITALDRTLDVLDEGHAVALELVGDPGMGKTRLLAELVTRAERRGHLVLSGSASELEVAQLIVDRRTNSEIAAELYLSQKTVESHIRNLFHKLDVRSRVEVARVVERALR